VRRHQPFGGLIERQNNSGILRADLRRRMRVKSGFSMAWRRGAVAGARDQNWVGSRRVRVIVGCIFVVCMRVRRRGVVMAVMMAVVIAGSLNRNVQRVGAVMIMGVRRRRRQDAVIGDGDGEN
jgi:hypothetical protein